MILSNFTTFLLFNALGAPQFRSPINSITEVSGLVKASLGGIKSFFTEMVRGISIRRNAVCKTIQISHILDT